MGYDEYNEVLRDKRGAGCDQLPGIYAMNICPYCEQNNREGVMLCDHCGRSLSSFANLHTRLVEKPKAGAGAQWHGSGKFSQDTRIVLCLIGSTEMLVLPEQSRFVLGRVNVDQRQAPDVDLTQFNGFEQGVSSRHAALERSDEHLLLIDLDSTNGTYLNRQQLAPHHPAIVQDGAEVQLGKLSFRLYFEGGTGTLPHA